MDILPIFYDHSSQKSILTWWEPKETKENGPQSILSLAAEAKLKEIIFVSTNFSTFLEAWKACKQAKIKLVFGIELILCDDVTVKNPESRFNEHKVIVFAKNSKGYQNLLKIYSDCHSKPENKYYIQRFDFNGLRKLWSKDLFLAIPFFDGFISKNLLKFGANIMPDLGFCGDNKIILREWNTLHPHEHIINDAINRYVNCSPLKEQKIKTIYYKNKKDFMAYSVYRSIQKGNTFSMPELDFFCSDTFCFETWKESK